MLKYEDIRSSLKSYDVLDCRSRHWFLRFIGHTAMVYKDGATGTYYVLESTNFTWTGISGVQITPMGLWLRKYPGKVWLLRVMFYEESEMGYIKRSISLKRFIKKHRGSSYPKLSTLRGLFQLFDAWWDGIFLGRSRAGNETPHCTHLTALAFRSAGYMRKRENVAEFVPKDITKPSGKFRRALRGCHLTVAERIK